MNEGYYSRNTNADSSRRRFIKSIGTAGTLGLSGMAGCTMGRTPSETVTIGALDPLTGPLGALAESGQKGADLAIEQINRNNEFDFEIEVIHEDSQGDTGTALRKAQKLVQQDGAEYLLGGTSSSVALAINEFAKSNGIITTPIAVATKITAQACNSYVFRFSSSVSQLAKPLGGYLARNVGTKVWFHIADYAYGHSIREDVAASMADVSDDFEVVGSTSTQPGETNFGSIISQIADSEADIVVPGMTGGDLISFVKQASNQGLTDQVAIASTTMSQRLLREALGSAAFGTFGAMRYLPTLDIEANEQFVDSFTERYGSSPDTFAAVNYSSIQMIARGIEEAEATNPDEVKDVLPGMKFENTVVGSTYFRDCDHQAVNNVWVTRNVQPDSGEVADLEVINEVDGESAIYPCGDARCTQ